ncbi:MAG: 50S ribosomal protein L30 [Clostridiaceae bacterium]|jgi:large subunit ribosomal protein L30|nr:50S ribosomal protein L30 [Oscillospiraceae bacterium]NLO62281.1 50S ribosomal protein L30 [Clostridiaceae bacterium]
MAELKVTLVKSTNSSSKNHCATVKALGLRKIGQSVVHADNDAIRGMLRNVSHLITFEEV